eukprot:COSAG02_NODE_1270_length_13529_cov_44.209680_5_plen_146_part_00
MTVWTTFNYELLESEPVLVLYDRVSTGRQLRVESESESKSCCHCGCCHCYCRCHYTFFKTLLSLDPLSLSDNGHKALCPLSSYPALPSPARCGPPLPFILSIYLPMVAEQRALSTTFLNGGDPTVSQAIYFPTWALSRGVRGSHE